MGSKRLSMRKIKIPLKQGKSLTKWEVSGPGLKTKRFQLKSSATEVFEAAKRVKKRRGQRKRRAQKNLYHCKYPMKGSSWHVVEASNMKAARRKFTKGSRVKPEDVKCKPYKGKRPKWMK